MIFMSGKTLETIKEEVALYIDAEKYNEMISHYKSYDEKIDAKKAEITRLTAEKTLIEDEKNYFKESIKPHLEEKGGKITAETGTLYFKSEGDKVEITDEKLIDKKYYTTKIAKPKEVVDSKKILSDLLAGMKVLGAKLLKDHKTIVCK